MTTCHYKENDLGMWTSECGYLLGPVMWDGFADRWSWCPWCGGEIDKTIHRSKADIEAEKADLWLQERKDMDEL